MGILGLSPFMPSLHSVIPSVENTSTKADNGNNIFSSERLVLKPFGYDEVKLQNSSLSRQIADAKNYYLHIPNDDLLKGFRERINLPTYGAKDLGGWYSDDLFHIFGQILSGLSRFYPVTGDEDCKIKVAALIEGWAECIEPDGYFYYSPPPFSSGHYIYDKMVGGLIDANVFAGNKNALTYLSTITDWAMKNLNRKRTYVKTHAKINNEWYTLSENLYRAYQITDDKKYYDFAEYWEYTKYWRLFANKVNIFTKNVHYHAYSHLNTFSSAAMAYIIKGEKHYLDTVKNGYDFFRNEECFATGGYGPRETLLPKDSLIDLLRFSHASFETQCGSWAAFKLCKYLLLLTGDARYGDWIEELIYNGAGADIPMSPNGNVLYYSDYNSRQGEKVNYYKRWTCCAGTRSENVAEYSNLVYFKKDNKLYVNLFTPSHVNWDGVLFTQATRFPESNEITFKIDIPEKGQNQFIINFRKPGWLKGKPQLFINKKVVNPNVSKNWLQINRNWKDGDEVKLIFPIQLTISQFDKEQKYPAAITYGPVVMAVRSEEEYPAKLLEKPDPFSDFTPVNGAPLNWHVKDNPNLLIRPYYAYKENHGYILYLDPSVENRILEKNIKQKGNWKRRRGIGYYYSNEKGASLTTTFDGTGIRLYLIGFPNSGQCEVSIDDKSMGMIDEYRPKNIDSKVKWNNRSTHFQKEYRNLSNGKHTIQIKVLDQKNTKSRNAFINVVGFETLDEI